MNVDFILTKRLASHVLLVMTMLLVVACAQTSPATLVHKPKISETLYDQLGGKEKLVEVSNRFIQEIGKNSAIVPYFERTNITRFHEKLVEHLCEVTNGPCTYTGDNMQRVHDGMNITQAHFNSVVEMLIKAMTDAQIPHRLQNKLLKRLAPMRSDIIKR